MKGIFHTIFNIINKFHFLISVIVYFSELCMINNSCNSLSFLFSYEYKEGDRVLGKPDKSDIWYTGKGIV